MPVSVCSNLNAYLFDFDAVDMCVAVFAIAITTASIVCARNRKISYAPVISFITIYFICLVLLHFWWLSLPGDTASFFLRALVEMGILTIIVLFFTINEEMRVKLPKTLLYGIIFGFVSTGFTALLFYALVPSPSFGYLQKAVNSGLTVDHFSIWRSVYFVLIAFFEECWFRAGIQKKLSLLFNQKCSFLVSILVASFLFSICHIGILREDWIKIFQTFILGILFGFAYEKGGLYSSVIAHSVLNVIVPYMELWLSY